jgi:hypothetical protein
MIRASVIAAVAIPAIASPSNRRHPLSTMSLNPDEFRRD